MPVHDWTRVEAGTFHSFHMAWIIFIRRALNGREVPFFTGHTAWRALIPDADPVAGVQVFMGPDRHLVSYPLADGLRNIVAIKERREWQDEGWSQPGDPVELRAAFAEFGGPVPDWLGVVRQVHLWGLFQHGVAHLFENQPPVR